MSLEASIAELTAAVRALTDVLLNPVQPQVISTPVEPIYSMTPAELSAEVKRQEEEIVAGQVPLTKAEIVGTEDLDSRNDEPLTYDDVKKATIALSAKSKAAAVTLLADYGVKKATELPQEQWARYVAQAKQLAA